MLTVKRQRQNIPDDVDPPYPALKDVRRDRSATPMTARWPIAVAAGQKSNREAKAG